MNTRSPNTPYWLRNGHADTLFAKLLQGKAPDYRRELLPDSTGKTQVAYDFVDSANPDAPLVVCSTDWKAAARAITRSS